jgi:hypothetical protein
LWKGGRLTTWTRPQKGGGLCEKDEGG